MQPSLFILAFVAAIAYAADPVSEGGVCGGGTANAPICADNLDCISTGGPGSTGICTRKSSDDGGPCEQSNFPDTSAQCKAGLVCVPASILPGSIPSAASGTCQPTPQAYVIVGGICGGGTQNSPICEPNLLCVLDSGAPGSTGRCNLKTNDAGGPCQQDFPNSAECKAGLICVSPSRPAVGPAPAGAAGMCQFIPDKYVPVGGVCGGATATSPVCESGLDCLVPAPFNYKAPGICTRREIDVGGTCDPSTQNSPCKTGLICAPSTTGGSGTCQTVATFSTTVVATKTVVTTAPAAPTSSKSAAFVVEGISCMVFSVLAAFVY
ncbi:hypothetical protein HDU79_000289 [Rhizoclosmatium sp. JEL0117]|nr:hypothetical protein HDU79_000289 [Rhizoclosmatium sp. JEL0117]